MTANREGFVNDQTRENWRKVAEALAIAGKTDSPFYKRAMIVIKTGRDPWNTEKKYGLGRNSEKYGGHKKSIAKLFKIAY